jgi:glycosyltransferase involved in cell wall biosynthesis
MAERDLIPVLMLVPYFAPQSHAAMFRAHKFARYLPEHGFKPIVVTTDTNYLYNTDSDLLGELPPEVEIHRARYIEPTLRGIRMALGGPDRSFKAMKDAGKNAPSSEGSGKTVQAGVGSRGLGIGGTIARLIGNYPDRHWTWSGPARRMAAQLIAQHDIKLLYTSANPISFLRAGLKLKRYTDVSWLFDARDPLGYGRKHTADGAIALLQERAILRRSIAAANHVTGSSSAYGQIFFDQYGLPEKKFDFIPTGLDETYLAGDDATEHEDFLLHVGEVMPDQDPHVFRVLEQILSQQGDSAFGRLVFVGRREVNEPRVRQLTSGLPCVQDRLKFLDHRPQSEVYDLIRRARACLLVPGPMRYWWNNFAKMVDYIALGTPVIAHVPPISEARNELEKAGTSFFLTGKTQTDSNALRAWLAKTDSVTVSDYSQRYTARRQVANLAAILNHLHDKQKG